MNLTPLPRSFYAQPTPTLAKQLLGQLLVHHTPEGSCIGKIVETEAYLYPDDEAAHTFRGETPRNRSMFGPGGHAYVYFTYGMHYCMNAVASAPGEGVLIRALEPIEGIELMKLRRSKENVYELCNGPAKLTQALAITREHNGLDLTTPPLFIARGESMMSTHIATTTRVGISQAKELQLRFYVLNSTFVSQIPKAAP